MTLERERSKNVLTVVKTSPPLFGAYSFFDRKILEATICTVCSVIKYEELRIYS